MERHFVILEKVAGQGYGFALYYDEETDSHRVRHIQSGSIADKPGHLHVGDRISTLSRSREMWLLYSFYGSPFFVATVSAVSQPRVRSSHPPVKVNGADVRNADHEEVVLLVKTKPLSVALVVEREATLPLGDSSFQGAIRA
jgi:C-terminal processing protease CtpA/Prc